VRGAAQAGLWACLAAASWSGAAAAASPEQIPVRVVVVTMFEVGDDTGDTPGELQGWVEDYPLPEVLPFPIGQRHLRYNPEKQVLALLTGIGTADAAESVMALGLDPRFDLSRAYWLVAGIAGANPDAAPLGSAVWAEWIVDGDLAHEIDPREAPSDWPTGYVPLFKAHPYQMPRSDDDGGTVYRLDPKLVEWAFELTRNIALPDSEALKAWRQNYAEHGPAGDPPTVMKGDTLSAMTFWHGRLLNAWAEAWVKYWTDGAGVFATSAMEDTGTLGALTALARAGRVDLHRVLVLRATSNFTMQHGNDTAAESLAGEGATYSAYLPALAAAYGVGSAVVNEIVDHWEVYGPKSPGAE
jgi:purine nucleoside permease